MARLPFNTDAPDSRYRRYDVRDWRDTPNIRVDRDMEEYLDEICVVAANFIGEKSDANELRTFYYNMMSDRGFRNREFEDLIKFCVGAFEWNIATSRNGRPEASLDKIIEAAVDVHTASMIDEYPDLERELNSQVARAAAKNADLYKEMVDAIADMQEGGRGRRGGRDRRDDRDDRDDRRRDRRDDRDDRRNDRDDRSFVRRDLQSRRDRDSDDRGRRGGRDRDDRDRRSGFARDDRQQSHSRDGMPQYRGEYSQTDTPPPSDDRQDDRRGGSYESHYNNDRGSRQEVADRRDSVRDVMRSARDTIKDDKFTEEHYEVETVQQPAPASEWKPAYEWEVYGENMGPNGESFMDYAKHAGAYPERGQPGVDMSKEFERFMTMVEANGVDCKAGSFKDLVDKKEEPEMTVGTSVSEIAITVTSESIHFAEKNQEATKVDERRSFRQAGVATNQFVGRPCLAVLQSIITKSSGLMDLHGKLKAAALNVAANCLTESPDTSEVRAAMNFINNQLTSDINRYLTHVLRLAEPGHQYIDSFMDDFADLPAHIEQIAGARQADWFMAWCTNYARSFGEVLDDKSLNLDEQVRSLGNMTEKMAYVAIPRSYLFTTVPFAADEMGLKNRKPVKLSEARMVLQILGRIDQNEAKTMTTYEYPTHVILTRDLKAYEVLKDPASANSLIMSPL